MGCKPCCMKSITNSENTVQFDSRFDNDIIKKPINELITSEYSIIENKNNEKNELKVSQQNYKYFFDILEQINKYRKRHNANPLNINIDISIIAQKHSDKIARENFIELSYNKYNNTELGEIIFSFK